MEYIGATHLTAIGPYSGRSYHFASSGATLPVDVRDHRSLARVPNLRVARHA